MEHLGKIVRSFYLSKGIAICTILGWLILSMMVLGCARIPKSTRTDQQVPNTTIVDPSTTVMIADPERTNSPTASATVVTRIIVDPTITRLVATAKPTSTMPDNFTDDFNTTRILNTGRDEYCEKYYQDGQFHIKVLKEPVICWHINDRDYRNFDAELNATIYSGDGNGGGQIDFIFGYKDRDNLCDFEVSRLSDFYRVRKRVSGAWVDISYGITGSRVNGPDSNSITTADLRIIMKDGEFQVYSSDVLLDTLRDESCSSGRVGFGGGTQGQGAHVSFDNFSITSSPTFAATAKTRIIVDPTITRLVATPKPTSMPDNFEDEFRVHGFLSPSEDEDCKTYYLDGQIHIEAKHNFMCLKTYPRTYKNFDAELNATMYSGEGWGGGGVALIFAYKDIDNYCDFKVNRLTGEYKIEKQMNAEWVTIRDWNAGSRVNGPEANALTTAHLRVLMKDGEFQVYSSDVLLETVKDESCASGEVGVAGSTWGQDAHVSFDNFTIKTIP